MEPAQPNAAVRITDHTSDDEHQPELTRSSQTDFRTASPTPNDASIGSPAAFSFPTLSPDGSVDDLSSAPIDLYNTTPPAALSSLGRRAKMPRTDLSDSISSLDEREYDMISDLSNDDRETASLASTERGEDNMTPDGSVMDLEEDLENLESTNTIPASVEDPRYTQIEQMKAENALLDSYMTDDLETTRQSLLRHDRMNPTPTRQAGSEESSKGPLRVLFVSEHQIEEKEIARMCLRVATCSVPSGENIDAPRTVRLPPTPQGGEPSSSMLVIAGDTEIFVDLCVHAAGGNIVRGGQGQKNSTTSSKAYNGRTASSNLVIYYLTSDYSYSWFHQVKRDLTEINKPSIAVGAPGFDLSDLRGLKKTLAYNNDLVLDNEEFFDENDGDVSIDLETLLEKSGLGVKSGGSKRKKQWPFLDKDRSGLMVLALFVTLGVYCVNSLFGSPFNSANELAVRRAALSNSLVEVMNTTDATKIFDIEHLVPQNSSSSYDVYYQGMSPNHLVLTIPKKTKGRGFSTPTEFKVYRSPDEVVSYNQTKLIDGIYYFSIALQEAHGKICVDTVTKDPSTVSKTCHNFGSRMWQRGTYEKAGMEISKAVNKDLIVASKRMKSLREILGVELTASAAATKNVTTQLAIYVARDLQLFADNAASMVGKINAAQRDVVSKLDRRMRREFTTDLETVQNGLITLQHRFQKSLQVTSEYTKDLVPKTKDTFTAALTRSRARALRIKERLQVRKQQVKKESEPTMKELKACPEAPDSSSCAEVTRKNRDAIKASLGPVDKAPEKSLSQPANVKDKAKARVKSKGKPGRGKKGGGKKGGAQKKDEKKKAR